MFNPAQTFKDLVFWRQFFCTEKLDFLQKLEQIYPIPFHTDNSIASKQ